MHFKPKALLVSLLLVPYLALAQPAGNAACTKTSAELEANKQLLREFFAFSGPDDARAERFLTVEYVQHNPRLLRMNVITGTTGREAWLHGFHAALRRGIDVIDLGGIQLGQPFIVMAECDLVTGLFRSELKDPDSPGETYEAFAFETFRVRDGKFSEHWDQVTLKRGWMQPPAGRQTSPTQ